MGKVNLSKESPLLFFIKQINKKVENKKIRDNEPKKLAHKLNKPGLEWKKNDRGLLGFLRKNFDI